MSNVVWPLSVRQNFVMALYLHLDKWILADKVERLRNAHDITLPSKLANRCTHFSIMAALRSVLSRASSPLLQCGRQPPTSSRLTAVFRNPSCRFYTIPIVVESGALGERSFDIYSRLLRERIICVHGEVTDQMASVVTAQLLFLEAEEPEKPLYMYINSPGGSVTAGMAMYDTMQYIRPQVHTICMGQAASMGSLLLAGGEPGFRKTLPHSSIMLHQPSGGASGMASDIEIRARELLRVRSRLNNLYVIHTGQELSEIERVMDRDTFMDAHEALKFGVVDTILDKRPTLEEEEAAKREKMNHPSS